MRIVALTERSDRKIIKEYMYHSYQWEQGEKCEEDRNWEMRVGGTGTVIWKKKPLERNREGEICFWVDIVKLWVWVMALLSEQLFPKEPH